MKNNRPSNAIGIIILFLLIESFVVALLISFFWRLSLQNRFDFVLTFIDWFGLVFAFKLIRFDIIKIMMNGLPPPPKEEDNEIQ